ncbi:hypothetical protein GCM10010201_17450 [Pilimelia columellifera subsp. columellifera]|uniref:N-acetyltransferase domain-containing protein n=1 Tax=Pilimelia columellifera subsp. columellifera TaxID=706583 RepID=A0ABN3NEZ1_9ACTN
MRRVREQDAVAVWSLRLQMLADTPLAFLETLADAAAAPRQLYVDRCVRNASGPDSAAFVAENDGQLVAQVVGLATSDPGETVVAAVYIAPDCRGAGLLGQLVEPVAAWSRGAGRGRLRLEVVDGNDRALRAYQKLGFVVTETGLPHPVIPGLTETRLRRAAGDRRAV